MRLTSYEVLRANEFSSNVIDLELSRVFWELRLLWEAEHSRAETRQQGAPELGTTRRY